MKCCFLLLLLWSVTCSAQETESDVDKAAKMGVEASAYAYMGETSSALNLLRKAQKLDPDALFYPLEIGFVYYIDGSYQKAVRQLMPLQFHQRCNATVYALLFKSLLADRQPKKAMIKLEEGLQKFPRSGQLCMEKALYYNDHGQPGECLRWLNRGIEVEPTYGNNYAHRALVYFNQGNKAEAACNAEMYLLMGEILHAGLASSILFKVYLNELRPRFSQPDSVFQHRLDMIGNQYVSSSLDSLCIKMNNLGLASFYSCDDQKMQQRLLRLRDSIAASGHLLSYLYGMYRFTRWGDFSRWQSSNRSTWKAYLDWHKKELEGLSVHEIRRP